MPTNTKANKQQLELVQTKTTGENHIPTIDGYIEQLKDIRDITNRPTIATWLGASLAWSMGAMFVFAQQRIYDLNLKLSEGEFSPEEVAQFGSHEDENKDPSKRETEYNSITKGITDAEEQSEAALGLHIHFKNGIENEMFIPKPAEMLEVFMSPQEDVTSPVATEIFNSMGYSAGLIKLVTTEAEKSKQEQLEAYIKWVTPNKNALITQLNSKAICPAAITDELNLRLWTKILDKVNGYRNKSMVSIIRGGRYGVNAMQDLPLIEDGLKRAQKFYIQAEQHERQGSAMTDI